MLNVLIVDDENIVRVGLRSIISWEEHGFRIAAFFDNGQDAFDYCLKNPPDILITDVKMPVMDGIDLIKKVRLFLPDVKIVVLSNYDNFQYVSTAYKTGIDDYILKQFLEPAKLLDVLNKIKKDLAINRPTDIPIKKDLHNPLRDDFIKFISAPNVELDAAGDESYLSSILSVSPPGISCMLIQMFSVSNGETACYNGYKPPMSNVKNIVQSVLNKYGDHECFSTEQNQILVILGFHEYSADSCCDQKLQDIFLDISETVKNIFNLAVKIGCSTAKESFAEIRASFIEAKKALEMSFFIPGRPCSVYHADEISQDLPEQIIAAEKELYKSLALNDMGNIKKNTQAIFDLFAQLPIQGIDRFHHEMISLVNYVDLILLRQFGLNIISLTNQNMHTMIQTIIESPDLKRTSAYIHSIIDLFCDTIKNDWLSANSIIEAKKFIDGHFAENIGLVEVARHLNISSCYLSKQFKKMTGENFSHYISGLRVQKAIELIRQNRHSTEDIAEIVGYPNTNYFVKVFKKVTGKTISDYKKEQG